MKLLFLGIGEKLVPFFVRRKRGKWNELKTELPYAVRLL